MKSISSDGNTYDLYFANVKMYNNLPPDYYSVRYAERRGFFLERQDPFIINDKKIYGFNNAKIDKVLKTFNLFNRNLGVILSGLKGMGKSLFAKQLAIKMVENNYPVIMVDKYFDGIEEFLKRIDQEVMILFDEFDKTFLDPINDVGMNNPQTYILSLFDGTDVGKRLFVITCNDINYLNDCIISRPGRFHYHFIFNSPSNDSIQDYLNDNINDNIETKNEIIDSILKLNKLYNLNFDSLRSIAFEINNGYSLEDTLEDLNIISTNCTRYTPIITYMKDSDVTKTVICKAVNIDILRSKPTGITLYNEFSQYIGSIDFNSRNLKFNEDGSFGINPVDVHISETDSDYEINVETTKILKVEFSYYNPYIISKFSKLI